MTVDAILGAIGRAGLTASRGLVATVGYIGRAGLTVLYTLSSVVFLVQEIGRVGFLGPVQGRPLRWRRVFEEFHEVGTRSLFVVVLTAFSLGFVIVLFTHRQVAVLGGATMVPSLMVVALLPQLGPLITGLVLAGRVGAATAARLGTMRVSDEILALETMAISPVSYLVVPIMFAALVMLPAMTIIADAVGILGGMVAAASLLGIDPTSYLFGIRRAINDHIIMVSLIKAIVFGFIIAITGAYKGLTADGGAEGVGQATMVSVMWAMVLIILVNVVLTLTFLET